MTRENKVIIYLSIAFTEKIKITVEIKITFIVTLSPPL